MKLSLAWIFDHIDVEPGTWRQFDADMIARRFNEVTAEIEHVEKRFIDLARYFLVFRRGDSWVVDETAQVVELKNRLASDFVCEDGMHTAFLVKKTDAGFQWATRQDFGVESEGLVPAVYAPPALCNGSWKKLWDATDIIIEVDNKSITHRPDMWGHRGFAREIAPFIGKKLKPAANFLHPHAIKNITSNDSKESGSAFLIKNEVPDLCKIFNGLFISSIENRPCDLKIMGRLMAVGAKPISGLVDLTNYITHDWGQPVHAYDADKIVDRTIVIRKAQQGEELMLLDSSSIELAFEDMVIADPEKPVCLAGVKGGMNDSISKDTTALFFEAANFDPGYVRRSGLRHKTRTDSSARFEKSLDRNLAVEAIQRFLALAEETGVAYEAEKEIISLGTPAQPKLIKLEHAFLEKRMGIELDAEYVKNLLTQIEFGVEYDPGSKTYAVTVPTFRASKDIDSKEDILEEVVRTYGFANIPLIMPTITRRPFSLVPVMRHRAIKRFLAHVAGLVEMQNYAFYDEGFLRSIDLEMTSPVELLNPVSENFRRLVTSLIPGLLKNVVENQLHHDALRFFESGRIWQEVNGEVVERKSLAACCVVKRAQVDFYDGKAEIIGLFDSLGIRASHITWQQVENPLLPWYKPFQTATFSVDGKVMGTIGKGNPLLYSKLGIPDELDGIFVEIDLEEVLALHVPVTRFVPLPRYQETYLDFSFMVPLTLRTAQLEQELQAVSPLVQRVELLDFFEKESWDNQRSLTFRMWVLDHEGTVDKTVLESLWQAAVDRTKLLGAVLRAA